MSVVEGQETEGKSGNERSSERLKGEISFHHENSQAAAQAAQGSCAASILGDFHGPAGQSPEQPNLISDDPAWSRRVDRRPTEVPPGLNYPVIH